MKRARLTPACMVGLLGLTACTPAPGETSAPPREVTFHATCSDLDAREETLALPSAKRVYDVDGTDDSVVVTVTGGALRSTDEGWAYLPFPVSRIASDRGGYIAVDAEGRVRLGSSDGKDWQLASDGLPEGIPVLDVALGGGVAVLIAGSTPYRLVDDVWRAIAVPFDRSWRAIATDGQSFLLSADDLLVQSTDGIDWEEVPILVDWAYDEMVLSGNARIALSSFAVARSHDSGLTWHHDADAFALIGAPRDLVTYGSTAIVASHRGLFAADGDGPFTALATESTLSLGQRGDTLYATTQAGLRASHDGLVWGDPIELPSVSVHSLESAAGSLYAVSPDDATYRRDGATWVEVMTRGLEDIIALETGGLVARTGNEIVYSDDGWEWDTIHVEQAVISKMVAVGSTLYAASATALVVGGELAGYGIVKSVDGGRSWSPANAGLPSVTPGLYRPVTALAAVDRQLFAIVEGRRLYTAAPNEPWTFANALPTEDDRVAYDRAESHDGYVFLASTLHDVAPLRVASRGVVMTLAAEGLPTGRIQQWAHAADALFALIPEWGVYVSRDAGASFALVTSEASAMGIHEGALWLGTPRHPLRRMPLGCD